MSKNKRKTKVKKPSEGGAARKEADAPRSAMVLNMLLHTKGGTIPDRRDRRSKDKRKERQAFNDAGGDEI